MVAGAQERDFPGFGMMFQGAYQRGHLSQHTLNLLCNVLPLHRFVGIRTAKIVGPLSQRQSKGVPSARMWQRGFRERPGVARSKSLSTIHRLMLARRTRRLRRGKEIHRKRRRVRVQVPHTGAARQRVGPRRARLRGRSLRAALVPRGPEGAARLCRATSDAGQGRGEEPSMQTKRAENRRKQPARDHYQDVTDKIIAALEAGVVPWRKAWDATRCGGPFNPTTGRCAGQRICSIFARCCTRRAIRGGAAIVRRWRGVGRFAAARPGRGLFFKPLEIDEAGASGDRPGEGCVTTDGDPSAPRLHRVSREPDRRDAGVRPRRTRTRRRGGARRRCRRSSRTAARIFEPGATRVLRPRARFHCPAAGARICPCRRLGGHGHA